MSPTIKILISNWPRTRKFSQLLQTREAVAFDLSHHGHTLRSIFMLWLVKIWGELVRKIYAASGNLFTDSWSWQSFVSSSDVFNCLSPLDVQNKIQLQPRFFCWRRNAPLFKVIGNPVLDGIVFRNELIFTSPCLIVLKSLKRFWPYLTAFRSCISTGKPKSLLYLMFIFIWSRA